MSAYHRLIVEEFRQHGGTLTSPQIAAVVGFGWRRDIKEMRRLSYPIIEDPTDLWHLDLEALPDVGGAVDAAEGRGACEGAGSSPDAVDEGEVEGELLTLDIDGRRPPASPYDLEAHEAA